MSYHNEVILGLDIGSSAIRACVCELDKSGALSLKGIGASITAGLSKGRITEATELNKAITRALQKARQLTGLTPQRVVTNLPLGGLRFAYNLGFIASRHPSGQITGEDRAEALKRAGQIFAAPAQKIMHVIPLLYKVDGVDIKNPIGSFGRNLEVQAHVILGLTNTVTQVSRILKENQLYINGLVYDPLATAQILLTETEKKNGCLFIDIGHQFTKVCIFKDTLLQHSFILPIGGATITHDLAVCLRITVPEAERLKIIYGNARLQDINEKEIVEVLTPDNGKLETKRILIVQIIEARLVELIEMIKNDLNNYMKQDSTYPCVLAGGGSQLQGLVSYFQTELNVPVRLGLLDENLPLMEKAAQATAVGLVLYGLKTGAIPFKRVQRWRYWPILKKIGRRLFGAGGRT